jgi:hypothetical protein
MRDRMAGSLVTLDMDCSVATLTMDDGKRNALSPAMFDEIYAAIHAGTGLTPLILADCTEPSSEGSNFLDVLPAWMLIHP